MRKEGIEKDEAFRDYALNMNMWKVLLRIGTPLALYQALNTLYKMLDSLMASHINAEAVSTVAYLSQINILVSSVGAGLAMGSSLKISEAYGAGDYDLVRKRVSSLFAMCGILDIMIFVLIPFTPWLLRLSRTPEELILGGSTYFAVELAGLAVTFFNNAYIAVERARGNTRKIFWLNMIVIMLKLVLTAVFVYVLECGITMIAVAGVISQTVLLVMGICSILQKGSAFCFDRGSVDLRKATIGPLVGISFPVIVEKAAFSAGKVIVNSMCSAYGVLTVGALGICNNITGLFANAQSGYQEGAAAIISQNLGGGKPGRALEAFFKIFVINLIFGTVGLVISFCSIDVLSYLYSYSSEGINLEFQIIIKGIFRYDAIGTIIPWGISASVMAFFYGLGKTKKILVINLCRLFAFRIFLLWILQRYTSLGSESVGIVMMASNTLTAILSCILVIFDLRVFRKEHDLMKN